jgi:transcriptional regulator with XRE-family HTH domain
MARTLDEVLAGLAAEERAAIAAETRALIAEELSLRELRRAMGQTQERLAATLGVSQDAVSRLEARSDLLLSTLRDYVAALGGELELVARLPGRPAVRLGSLGELSARDRPPRRRRARGSPAA